MWIKRTLKQMIWLKSCTSLSCYMIVNSLLELILQG